MQLTTTIKRHEISYTQPQGMIGLGRRGLSFFMAVTVAAFAMFTGMDVFAAVPTSELSPLTVKASDWAIAIAFIGILLGLGFGFGKAATTNRWEPALQPIGIGVLWGAAFGIIGVAFGAPLLV
jgi:hypothetical protein